MYPVHLYSGYLAKLIVTPSNGSLGYLVEAPLTGEEDRSGQDTLQDLSPNALVKALNAFFSKDDQ